MASPQGQERGIINQAFNSPQNSGIIGVALCLPNLPHTYTYTHTHTYTNTYTHTHIHTDAHTHTDTQTRIQINT